MSPQRRARLGLRREILLLLPVSILALVLLSTFTYFTQRSATRILIEQRQGEAALLAGEIAQRLHVGDRPRLDALRQLAPHARGAALVDEAGTILASTGFFAPAEPLEPLADREMRQPVGTGPDSLLPGVAAGFARLQRESRDLYVRVDLPAEELWLQLRSLRILGWLVIPVNFLLLALVVVYVRHLVSPYDALLEKARTVATAGEEEDEISFLVATFERALAALAKRPEQSHEDDIAALQRALAPSLESGLLLLDRDGKLLALNAVGSSLLEVEAPELGSPVAEVLPGQPELLSVLRRAIDQGTGLQRQEVTVRSASGHRALGLTVHALRRDDGGVRGFLVLFVDLTEAQRQAEEQRLAESLADLGALAAGIAHELRNSLATLRGYLTLIERHPEEESITDYLTEIRRESDHLQRVLEDFLVFARPETTRIETVDLLAVARRAASDPGLEGQAVRVLPDEGGGIEVQGDPQLLGQAIRNLLQNAAQAQRQAGEADPLVVTLQAGDQGTTLSIEDRGPGLPEEVRRRLFQPFVTGRADGVGLGLSLAHRIVTLHGGTVRLEDRPEGGTRAVISFPAGTSVT